jgi:hypothetical protein
VSATQTAPTTQAPVSLRPTGSRKRAIYTAGERQVSLGRLTTRCPTILRDYLKFTASHPMSGYRSFTHMVTVCLLEFLDRLPKTADATLAWAKGRGASDGTVLVHANTERTMSACSTTCVEGCDLAERAIAVAELHGVNMSSFTLSLLFWMATEKHPPADAKMKRAIAVAKKECYA